MSQSKRHRGWSGAAALGQKEAGEDPRGGSGYHPAVFYHPSSSLPMPIFGLFPRLEVRSPPGITNRPPAASPSARLVQEDGVVEQRASAAPGRRRGVVDVDVATAAAAAAAGSSPEDVLADLLSRVPVKALLRFRAICRSWCQLISDPRFVRRHMDRSKTSAHLILWPYQVDADRTVRLFACRIVGGGNHEAARWCVLDGPFLIQRGDLPQEGGGGGGGEESTRLSMATQHCDGLLLFTSARRIFVCNPSTRELVALPEGSRGAPPACPHSTRAALGLDPFTGEYRVARCFCRSHDFRSRTCSMGCELLTLGGGPGKLSWKATASDPPYPVKQSNVAFVGGAVYWKVRNARHSPSPKAILALDLKNEQFKTVAPPPCFAHDPSGMDKKTSLNEIGGNLCLTHIEEDKGLLDIWVLTRGRSSAFTDKWTKEYAIKLPEGDPHPDFLALDQGKLLLYSESDVSFYDPENGVVEETVPLFKALTFRHYCQPETAFWSGSTGIGVLQVAYCAESLVCIGGGRARNVT